MGKLFFNNHPFLANVFQSSFSKNKTKQYFIYLFILKSKKYFSFKRTRPKLLKPRKACLPLSIPIRLCGQAFATLLQ